MERITTLVPQRCAARPNRTPPKKAHAFRMVGLLSLIALISQAHRVVVAAGRPHAAAGVLAKDLRLAERYFRQHVEAYTVYRKRMRLNPRQVYLFQVKTAGLAKAYFRDAWQCYRELRAHGGAVSAKLSAALYSDYAWYIYGAPIFLPPRHPAKVMHLLKVAQTFAPRDLRVLAKITYLDWLKWEDMPKGPAKALERATIHRLILAELRAHPQSFVANANMAGFLFATLQPISAQRHYFLLAAQKFGGYDMELVKFDLTMREDAREIIAQFLKANDPKAYKRFVLKFPPMN